MKDARAEVEALRREIPDELRRLRDLDFRSTLSGQVTLSTFHGCPADEIEAMAVFLMEEMGLHVTVKLNPTLLGRDAVDGLLHDVLGYRDVETRAEDFEKDLQWGHALEMTDRLVERARGARARAPPEALEHAGGAQPPAVLPAGRGGDVPLGPAAPRDHPGPRRAGSPRAARRAAVLLRRRRQPQLRRLRGPRPRAGDGVHRPPQAGRLRSLAEVPREPRGADAGARRTSAEACRTTCATDHAGHGRTARSPAPVARASGRALNTRYRAEALRPPRQDRPAPRPLRLHQLRQVPARLPERRQLRLRGRAAREGVRELPRRGGTGRPRGRRALRGARAPPDRELPGLLQRLRQLRHVLPRGRRAVPGEAPLLRLARGLAGAGRARRLLRREAHGPGRDVGAPARRRVPSRGGSARPTRPSSRTGA